MSLNYKSIVYERNKMFKGSASEHLMNMKMGHGHPPIRSQRCPISSKENDSHRYETVPSQKENWDKWRYKAYINAPTEMDTKGFPNLGALFTEVPASDTVLTPKSSRKSAEVMRSVSPISSLHSKCSSLNSSHPPLVHSSNSGGATVTNKNGSKSGTKVPLTRGTPRGLTRTPRNADTPLGTPFEEALNADEGRCTPLSASISVTPTSSARRSFGNAQKNGMPSDIYTLRKADIQNGVLNLDDADLRREDESSTVSVGVRVRPLSDREKKSPNIRSILLMEGNEIVVHCENGSVHSFNYDLCFWSCDPAHPNHASQEQVYDSVARPLLVHAYEGYNVCLFAYGQTGSGKSYCIMGEDKCSVTSESEMSKEVGIIPRFCRGLFAEADLIHSRNSDQDVKRKVAVEISYIEIYNEKIYDLVSWQNPSCSEEQRIAGSNLSGEKRDPLRIREHPVHGPHVVGASCHLVTSYQDLETWINLGNKQRSIAATGMNDKSSRSHSVFSVKVTQTQIETIEGEEMEHSLASLINIVDLAGSERVAASHSEGDRLKEGVYINKSLLTLGKVITALAEIDGKRRVFIPYRESALTWLLKESLGGNSKTTMIATVSPCNIHQEETLSTLRYAQQARKIVNWNRINEDPTSKIIRALKLEVERLRSLQISSPRLLTNEVKVDENEPQNGGSESKETEQEEEMTEQRLKEKEIIRAKEREISFLKEKLRATQEHFSERTKLWEDKLLEAEMRKKEALERCRMKGLALKLEENEPTLIHLCEDPQLSQTLLYSLKKGSTTLGTSNADVTLSRLHETDIHCSIFYEGDQLVLYPKEETETYVNGKLVTTPTQMFHNDRVVLAGVYFFKVCFPASFKEKTSGMKCPGSKYDFLYARDELLKEQEDRIRREMSIQQAATRAEMLRELEEQRLELKLQEMSMKENVKVLSSELEEERNLNQETEMARLMLEEEKQHLEAQVKALKRLNSQASSDGALQSPSPTRTSFFEEMEAIFDESVQIVETKSPEFKTVNVEMWFMVAEANSICSQLKKSYKFQQQSRLGAQGFEITILVHDMEHNLFASVDMERLKEVLNILRDLVSGEQDDDTLLDASIPWERHEGISKLPFVHNKMRENIRRLSINQSLNSSILTFSLNNCSVAARRLSVRGGINQNGLKTVPLNPINQSVILAKGVSQALLKLVSPSTQNSPFADALSHLIQFHKTVKEFPSYCHESGVSEDRLNEQILRIAMLTPAVDSSLGRLGSISFSDNTQEVASDLQAKISTSGSKFARKTARMLQGVENGVDTLTEEESSDLTKLIHELIEDIGFLNLIVSYELPRGSDLISSLTICAKYLMGVSRGLEWKVKMASRWTKTAASVIVSPIEDSPSCAASTLRKCAVKAITKTAAFLSQFSQLKVEPNVEETMPLKEAKHEACRFLGRVAAASENVQELVSALASITGELGAIDGNIHLEALGEAVIKLKESLGDLVGDAGVGSFFERRKEQTDSVFSDTSVELYLDNLHSQAMQAFKCIKALRNAVGDAERVERSRHSKDSPVQCHLEGKVAYAPKSSLRSGLKRSGEKKVRFNVSLSSSTVGSFMEYGNDDDVDVMDV